VKISKTTWICLIAGIFIIAGITLGMSRSQQTDRQQKLQEKLTQANLKLSQIKVDELIDQREALASQVSSYETQTAATLELLNYSGDSIDTTAEILAEGQKEGVDIDEIVSPGVSSQKLDGANCEVLQLNIQVSGSIPNISSFISGLSKTFPTSVIKSVQLEIPPPPTEIAYTEKESTAIVQAAVPKKSTVRLNMLIYNFKGKN
jgi:hypothetical protein